VKVTDFGMSRIIPEKIQDIEKGVEGPGDQTPEKPAKNASSGAQGESKNGEANASNEDEEASEGAPENRKKVNFNEEANVSWERESILGPDDSAERHSNLLVWQASIDSTDYLALSSLSCLR
jgi:hypothetical protein